MSSDELVEKVEDRIEELKSDIEKPKSRQDFHLESRKDELENLLNWYKTEEADK